MPRRKVRLPRGASESAGDLVGFTITAVVVGALTGLCAGAFRLSLDQAARWRDALVAWAHGSPVAGFLLVVVICAGATAAAAALVRRVEPHAEGSGIPRVEAVVADRIEPARARLLPVKFAGGFLAIGAGLALGREGPSVQMGANIATTVGKVGKRSPADVRVLIGAGAAAGLATTFNAPMSGGIFVLEELVRRFEPRTTLATLLASGSGFAAAKLAFGDSGPLFEISTLAPARLEHAPAILVVGLITGLLGVFYNRMILGALAVVDRIRWPREVTAGLIGAAVGALAFVAPGLVGGGDPLTQDALLGRGTIGVLLGVLAIRFVLGFVSYAAGTPGGLFAPMLVVGGFTGLVVGLVGGAIAPDVTPQPEALALVGIASFFTASVRAPITGIVLATELTGATSQLSPMLGACGMAMLVASIARSEPIYDALATRSEKAAAQGDST